MSREIAGDRSMEETFVLDSEHEESLLTAITEGRP